MPSKKKTATSDTLDNVTDINTAKDEVDEVETITFTVTIKGKDIELTCPRDLLDGSDEVLEHFEENKNIAAFYALIGPAQKMKLRAAGCTGKDLMQTVIPTWQEAAGLGE